MFETDALYPHWRLHYGAFFFIAQRRKGEKHMISTEMIQRGLELGLIKLMTESRPAKSETTGFITPAARATE